METKTPPPVNASYHHQRAPRTPESYFNVPESVALLNIVKSERIQSAFQSNRKNHASVWEMVAEVLNRFSARKRTAKQCCNRYENLKKIYTQLKKNPERHVRRNWPYMFLFKEIEEQRGECWGSNGKRLALISKNHNELSYYQRRRQAAELGVLLNKDNLTPHQHSLLQSLSAQSHAHSTDSSQSGASKLERFLPNHFVETQLGGGGGVADTNGNGLAVGLPAGVYDDSPLQLQVAGAVAAAAAAVVAQKRAHELQMNNGGGSACGPGGGVGAGGGGSGGAGGIGGGSNSGMGGCGIQVPDDEDEEEGHRAAFKDHHGHHGHGLGHGIDDPPEAPDYEKDCNGALNLHHHHHHHHHQNSSNNDNNISMKSEPLSEGEFNPDDIQLMQTNYNGTQNFYSSSIDQNILHPDVIVDTDNLSDCSLNASMKSVVGGGGAKRKLSTSTDGDSTNYELIEYLKRREKRDEELLKRMDAREERFMNLLERTVIAIETLAAGRSEPTASSVSAAATKIAPITAPGTTTTTPVASSTPSQPTTTTTKAETSDETSQETNNQIRAPSPPLCLATSTNPPPAEQSNASPCSPRSPSPVTATSEDVIVLVPDEQEA